MKSRRNMDAPELSVYGEAKSEYTRQLCVFLVPSLEGYFLELLASAKEQSPSPQKALWEFQTLLQAIPDWNQDKVVRETERLQKDTKCDYLEELLTAVFIAHTKVLSAIRLTTKQKKLQITIPKLDHFLHRVLSDCARSLWTNAYLFADGNSIERQKNLRQVSALLQEAVLQAIRGMLPVKNILREYLSQDDEEEEQKATHLEKDEEETTVEKEVKVEEETTNDNEEKPVEEKPVEEEEKPVEVGKKPLEEEVKPEEQVQPQAEVTSSIVNEQPPVINIDTKQSVSFSNEHVFFDSDNLEANEIHELPFAEAENRPPEEDEEEDEEDFDESIKITDELLPMDAEVLE